MIHIIEYRYEQKNLKLLIIFNKEDANVANGGDAKQTGIDGWWSTIKIQGINDDYSAATLGTTDNGH